jgi:hypothetical protein
MSICRGTKPDGAPCTLAARDSSGLCWAHSPEHAKKRQLIARKGGKARAGGGGTAEVAAVSQQLQTMADGVAAGKLDRADAVAIGQLLNARLRALELLRRWKETDQLEARLEQLERETPRETS